MSMGTVVSLDEFRKNLSDIVARVMYGNQTFVVQRHNKTGVIVISEKEYENLKDPRKRLSKKEWKEGFKRLDEIRAKIPRMDPVELDEIIDEEVIAVRAKKKKALKNIESTKNLLALSGIIPKGSGLPKDLSAKHDDYAWD